MLFPLCVRRLASLALSLLAHFDVYLLTSFSAAAAATAARLLPDRETVTINVSAAAVASSPLFLSNRALGFPAIIAGRSEKSSIYSERRELSR